MAIESPLFQSAMELLGHSFSHYNGEKELDRKLVILHLANSIELILKDLVLDTGQSIYKNPKETITIHGCISILKDGGIDIPFLNKIELLIDERNALQHRFGSPNELTSIFYMNIAQGFFKEILKKHYGQDYDEVISQFSDEQDLVAYKLSEPSNNQELEKLKELAKIHPLGALLSAWSYFEKITETFMTEAGLDFRRRRPFTLERDLESYGISVPDVLKGRISKMRFIRNMAAHGREEPSKLHVDETIDTIEELEKHLKSLDLEKVKNLAREHKERYEAERQEHLRLREEQRERFHAQNILNFSDEPSDRTISHPITLEDLGRI